MSLRICAIVPSYNHDRYVGGIIDQLRNLGLTVFIIDDGSGPDVYKRQGHRPVMATVPHRHIFGLTFHLLWPLARGQPFMSHVDELWESMLARDLTDSVVITSPAHLIRCLLYTSRCV